MTVDRALSPSAFGLFDPDVQQRPFEAYAGLRDRGALEVIDPTAVRTVLRDPRTFSSRVLPCWATVGSWSD
jgi:cytochrome P450